MFDVVSVKKGVQEIIAAAVYPRQCVDVSLGDLTLRYGEQKLVRQKKERHGLKYVGRLFQVNSEVATVQMFNGLWVVAKMDCGQELASRTPLYLCGAIQPLGLCMLYGNEALHGNAFDSSSLFKVPAQTPWG